MQHIKTLSLAPVLAMALTAIVAGCGPKPAAKTEAPAATGKDAARQEAGKLVTELMAPTFSGEQQGRILNMGYFMAASSLCPDLEVDAAKMGRAVEAVLALDSADETAAEKQHKHDAVIMFLGMSSGAMIGSHIEGKAAFCEDAAKVKGGAADTHLFTAGSPSAPSTAPVPGEAAKP
jgi:hypothetical protein